MPNMPTSEFQPINIGLLRVFGWRANCSYLIKNLLPNGRDMDIMPSIEAMKDPSVFHPNRPNKLFFQRQLGTLKHCLLREQN
jgi:hypothetical protein